MTTCIDVCESDALPIDALPAREVHVGPGSSAEYPVMLTSGIYGRNGRGGAALGLLLTNDNSFMLLQDLADFLGVALRPARTSRVWRAIRWPRRREEVRIVERYLARTRTAPPAEDELTKALFGVQIPAQRPAAHVAEGAEDTQVAL
jgi:hypothetical protein